MEKTKIGQLIKTYREVNNLKQKDLVETLKTVRVRDVSHLSKIESGSVADESLYADICQHLGIEYENTRLTVAFSQGFWAAPMIWINEHVATDDFFEHIALTAYTETKNDRNISDKSFSNTPLSKNNCIFNTKRARLPQFDADKHAFFYSGEIADLLLEGKIDIGFLGSTVIDAKELVRVARLVNAGSMRHAMIVVDPKNKLKNKETAIDFLLGNTELTNEAHIYYQAKSTAEHEYRSLLQHTKHWHNTLPVLDLPKFKQSFDEKLRLHNGEIVAHIGLMLSVETAKQAAKQVYGKNYEPIVFRTSDIAAKIPEKVPDFYYEMVVSRNNEKIRKIAEHKGFHYLLKLLRGAVDEFSKARYEQGIPLSHRKVAEFFGLNLQQASDMLKQTEFELVFYPEWVNKVLGIN
ncbi:MAG: hypothetical protein U5L45_20910 [Saprospiraceae bacterium]|nr:hypothetical protein [Saprospiraceae bacterium]MDZ7880151.1 hypothetical protein [Saprospiraceae bacterium]